MLTPRKTTFSSQKPEMLLLTLGSHLTITGNSWKRQIWRYYCELMMLRIEWHKSR